MRTIKFRGKSKIYGCWRFGDLFRTNLDGDMAIQFYDEVDGWMTEDVNEKTVGQFTGIKDINGKEIYEGDIVCSIKNRVAFNTITIVDFENLLYPANDEETAGYKIPGHSLTVMGNIYDNPELLKGGAK